MKKGGQENKFEDRIRFVAKHYREERLDENQAWRKFTTSQKVQRIIPWRRYLTTAAAVILLLAGFRYWYIWDSQKPQWVMHTAGPASNKEILLPDGTLVTLFKGSEIRYDHRQFGNTARPVLLNGKAWFDVSADAMRPFSITTSIATLTVLGTTFQVSGGNQSFEVDVFSGKVQVTLPGKGEDGIILTAGMSAAYSTEKGDMEVKDEADPNRSAWKTGQLRFQETPLEDVVRYLEDYYDVSLKRDEVPNGLRLNATFTGMALEEVLLVINQTLDIQLKVLSKP